MFKISLKLPIIPSITFLYLLKEHRWMNSALKMLQCRCSLSGAFDVICHKSSARRPSIAFFSFAADSLLRFSDYDDDNEGSSNWDFWARECFYSVARVRETIHLNANPSAAFSSVRSAVQARRRSSVFIYLLCHTAPLRLQCARWSPITRERAQRHLKTTWGRRDNKSMANRLE